MVTKNQDSCCGRTHIIVQDLPLAAWTLRASKIYHTQLHTFPALRPTVHFTRRQHRNGYRRARVWDRVQPLHCPRPQRGRLWHRWIDAEHGGAGRDGSAKSPRLVSLHHVGISRRRCERLLKLLERWPRFPRYHSSIQASSVN